MPSCPRHEGSLCPRISEIHRSIEQIPDPDQNRFARRRRYVRCHEARAFEGAYFARGLAEAKAQGRIGNVTADPLLPLRAFFDLGGSGARADAMAIWIVQWAGREIRILDYIEGVGQVLAHYVNEVRS